MTLSYDEISRSPFVLACIVVIVLSNSQVAAQSREPDYRDVVYGTVNGRDLLLDVYLPDSVDVPSLIVWVHGGAWRGGSKERVPGVLVEKGFALASLDFRLSTEAQFPAQVHDIKAAIRFLRGERSRFGFQTDRIAIAGASSGGHLAALVGITNGHPALEGTIGDHLDESSHVQAIVSYYGASNLTTILSQSTPHGLRVRKPALDLFLGAQPDSLPDVAKLASPVFHVDVGDPPLLLLHGDQDPQMPINQSHELVGMYRQHGVEVLFNGENGKPLAVREFQKMNGGFVISELLEYDETKMWFKYRIIKASIPLRGYVGEMQVVPADDGGSVVLWSAQFQRPDETPKPDEDDLATEKLVQNIFKTGLNNLPVVISE